MIDPTSLVVLAIVLVTLGFMLARPGNLAEGCYALAGAIAMLLTGAVAPADVPALIQETGDVLLFLLFLLGMLALTGIVERARLFDIIAELCARWSGGNGRVLFVSLYSLGALVTTFLSLDVTVILLTPIVLAVTSRRNIDPVPLRQRLRGQRGLAGTARQQPHEPVALRRPGSLLSGLRAGDVVGPTSPPSPTWERCPGSSGSGYPGGSDPPSPISRRSASPRRGPRAAGSFWS